MDPVLDTALLNPPGRSPGGDLNVTGRGGAHFL